MIELANGALGFLFPDVHSDAHLITKFVRTLRIPDDSSTYPRPSGFGDFPLVHVEDYPDNIPLVWIEHGGVILPMYRSEALYLSFSAKSTADTNVRYPFAIKIATGKINALTGQKWVNELQDSPQDYVVSPPQAHIDGYCVKKGVIRQFLAAPLGLDHTTEEQLTSKALYGGIQICAYPLKREEFERRFAGAKPEPHVSKVSERQAPFGMGLGPGGLISQEISQDPYGLDAWDIDNMSRCFVHLADSALWEAITGDHPPDPPLNVNQYNNASLPWLENQYSPTPAHEGSAALESLKSVPALDKKDG